MGVQESTGKCSRVGSTSLTTMFLHIIARWSIKPVMDSIPVQVIYKISQREMCHCNSFFPLLKTVPSAFCSPLLCHALLPVGYRRDFIPICRTGLRKSALPFGQVIWGCFFSMSWVFLKMWLFCWLSISDCLSSNYIIHLKGIWGFFCILPIFQVGKWNLMN